MRYLCSATLSNLIILTHLFSEANIVLCYSTTFVWELRLLVALHIKISNTKRDIIKKSRVASSLLKVISIFNYVTLPLLHQCVWILSPTPFKSELLKLLLRSSTSLTTFFSLGLTAMLPKISSPFLTVK